MSQNERGTIRTLTAYKEAISKLIQEYKGRVVDAPGDNPLVEFGSVIDAVNCAVEIQRELGEKKHYRGTFVAICAKLKYSGYDKGWALTQIGDWAMYDLGMANQNYV